MPLPQPDHDGVVRAVEGRRRGDVGELAAEGPGLLVGPLGELGPRDPAGEAEVVADQRAGAGLAPDGAAFDDERAQPLGRGVDGGGQSRGPGAHDDDVERRVVVDVDDQAVRGGELGVGGVDEDPPVVQQHHRLRPRRHLRLTEQLGTLERVALDEPVRDAAVREHPSHLVRPRAQAVAHDRDLPGAQADRPVPLDEELGHRPVEVLVGRVPRPDDVVVDLALGHQPQDQVGGVRVAPGAPLDEEAAARVGEELRRQLEDGAPGLE